MFKKEDAKEDANEAESYLEPLATQLIQLSGKQPSLITQDFFALHALALSDHILRYKLNSRDTIDLLMSIGWITREQADYQISYKIFNQCVALCPQVSDIFGVFKDRTLEFLAASLDSLGRYKESLTYYEEALRILRLRWFADENQIGRVLTRLGDVRCNLGYHEDSLLCYQDALVAFESRVRSEREMVDKSSLPNSLAPFAPSFLVTDTGLVRNLNNMGYVTFALGKYELALSHYYEMLSFIKTDGSEDMAVAFALNELGCVYAGLGDYEKAEQHLRAAVSISQSITPEVPLFAKTAIRCLNNLANFLYITDRHEESILYRQAALKRVQTESLKKHLFSEKLEFVQPMIQYKNFLSLHMMGFRSDQDQFLYCERVLKVVELTCPEVDIHSGASLHNLGNSYFKLGKYQDALETYRDVLKIKKQVNSEDRISMMLTLNGLAATLGKLGHHKEALSYYERVLEDCKIVFSENNRRIVLSLENIAITLSELGHSNEACRRMQDAFTIIRKTLDKTHPDVQRISNCLLQLKREALIRRCKRNIKNYQNDPELKWFAWELEDLIEDMQTLNEDQVTESKMKKMQRRYSILRRDFLVNNNQSTCAKVKWTYQALFTSTPINQCPAVVHHPTALPPRLPQIELSGYLP